MNDAKSATMEAEAKVSEKAQPSPAPIAIKGGVVNIFGNDVDLKASRKVKKSLVPAKVVKDDATVEDCLVAVDAQIADLLRIRAALTAHPTDADKLAHGISLIGGGNSVEANFQALRNYREGRI